MITTIEIFSIIHRDGFFEKVFHKEVDWDAELDARDDAEFDRAWRSSYEELNQLVPDENELIRDIREFAFKQTFRITQNPELAGYTSDDFGLISKAFDNKVDIPFIQNLWQSYLQGKFPT
ncbi:hypothetical protein NQ117_01975 [Paenibacillus sp. SC116]|uniref:hypothetical protein n=1 Tax=Paenibacillus sp. SC116 TaxID=2968986 RepID=UPI00215B07F8|nr:hypothetical protein [Paenibacillus sp. SC116]MCR8842441.1 hypothetical protein [Paenibacillus sp. SC116]